jgi:hypothetical protein
VYQSNLQACCLKANQKELKLNVPCFIEVQVPNDLKPMKNMKQLDLGWKREKNMRLVSHVNVIEREFDLFLKKIIKHICTKTFTKMTYGSPHTHTTKHGKNMRLV